MAKMIDGEVYKDMILQAAAALEERMEETNALNVFPVPDGDTGTNMSMTLNSAVAELNKLESPTLGRALEVTSSALLRGARGNSGVITSLLFRGMGKAMKDCRTADGAALAAGLAEGAATAYKAVMKPAEGPILTVARPAGAGRDGQSESRPEKGRRGRRRRLRLCAHPAGHAGRRQRHHHPSGPEDPRAGGQPRHDGGERRLLPV